MLGAVLAGAVFLFALSGHAAPPAGSGIVDLAADYGVVCDGVADQTAKINQAIREAKSNKAFAKRILLAPAGTCIITDRLLWSEVTNPNAAGHWQQNLALQGAGRTLTTFKVPDNHPNYNNVGSPRAVIYTASKHDCGTLACAEQPDWLVDGSGNKAFHNYLSDFTVNCGIKNPGCIGIDYLANNVGSIRDVGVTSNDRLGYAGIRMERYGPGPLLLSRVTVTGFDYGIRLKQQDYGVVLDFVTLLQYRIAGIRNEGNIISASKLNIQGTGACIDNIGTALFSTVDTTCTRTAEPAIIGSGRVYARNLRTIGYELAVTGLPGGSTPIEQYTSQPVQHAFNDDLQTSLGLPLPTTPPDFVPGPADGVSVLDFGAIPWDGLDDSAAFQAAFDSGKAFVYADGGDYHFAQPVTIPSTVRLFHGHGAAINPTPGAFNDANDPPAFTVSAASANLLTMKRTWIRGFATTALRHASTRTLSLKDLGLGGAGQFLVESGSGPVFIENIIVGRMHMKPGTTVTARQLNTESTYPAPEMVLNEGGKLNVVGWKIESPKTVAKTTSGGCTEVTGGLFFPIQFVPANRPMFQVVDSKASFSVASSSYVGGNSMYTILIEETRAGVTQYVTHTSANTPRGNGGTFLTLGSAHNAPCP
jgi:hypothetical protein